MDSTSAAVSSSTMDPKTIIMLVCIFILVYIIYYYFIQSKNMLTSGTTSGTQVTVIPAPTDTSTNFTYSLWFNINDWNYNYGSKKILFTRGDATANDAVCPEVSFDSTTNNMTIQIATTSSTTAADTTTTVTPVATTCTVSNIPIQRWVHLLISVYGRSLDTYLDGKMVSTCILPGPALITKKNPILLTPKGGFNGWTRQFQYWANATDPQTAWNIYQQGDGSNIFSNIFGNYGLQISLLNGSTVQNSITI